jgi:hypothetical protein
MQRQLTRRQFSQGVLAGAGVLLVGHGRSPVLAQSAPLASVIVGVRPGLIPSPNANTHVDSDTPDTEDIITVPSTASDLILEALNLATGQIRPFPGPRIPVASDEQVSGCTFVADGSLVVALTDISARQPQASPTRLVLLGPSPSTVAVSGLQKHEGLRSLVGTQDGRLLGLVMKHNGTPPVRVVEVDWHTGQVTKQVNLPGNQRIQTLAACPDGTLYTIGVDKDGNTSLLVLNVQHRELRVRVNLQLKGKRWDNSLESLVCSPAHQLLAFGALRYAYPKALYSVDASSGAMTQLVVFNTAKITLLPES